MKLTLKNNLTILAVVAALLLGSLTVVPVDAYQGGVGGSPYASDLLVSGLNTGLLDPGQEYWYAYSRLDLGDAAYDSIILSLNFEAEGVAVANRVNFQVFTFEQVEAWLKDNSGPVDSLGLGTPASADFDANTGERLWSGPVASGKVYYVRIFNLSPSPVQFRLTALGQTKSNFEGFMVVDQSGEAQESGVIPAAINVPGQTDQNGPDESTVTAALPVQPDDDSPASTSWLLAAQAIQGLPPQEAAAWLMSAAMLGWLPGGNGGATAPPAAVPVDPNPGPIVTTDAGDDESEPDVVIETPAEAEPEAAYVPDPGRGDSIYPNQPLRLLDGPNTGLLGPKTEHWYTFTPGKVDDQLIENLSLTMFFTPGEPNLARHVTFEMFTGSQYHIWERGTPLDMEHFGVGSWVSRDNDYDTGERLWHGTVVDGDQYFVKITNDTNKWVDYHLLPGDIINTELGASTAKAKPANDKVAPALAAVATNPTGKDIGSPLLLTKNYHQNTLAAGEARWFRYNTPNTNPDSYDFLSHLIELTHKPGYGRIAHFINVEIYPFQEQAIWRRGDGDEIKPLGVGSFTEYNEAADTHSWVWDGHLVSNTTYFIKVRNDSWQDIDYDLAIKRR